MDVRTISKMLRRCAISCTVQWYESVVHGLSGSFTHRNKFDVKSHTALPEAFKGILKVYKFPREVCIVSAQCQNCPTGDCSEFLMVQAIINSLGVAICTWYLHVAFCSRVMGGPQQSAKSGNSHGGKMSRFVFPVTGILWSYIRSTSWLGSVHKIMCLLCQVLLFPLAKFLTILPQLTVFTADYLKECKYLLVWCLPV